MACCKKPNSQNPCREPWNRGKIVGQKAPFKTWRCSTSALRSMSAPGCERNFTNGCFVAPYCWPANPMGCGRRNRQLTHSNDSSRPDSQ